MPEKIKAILCWSGGKDSSLALHDVLNEGVYDVKYLLTTINENFRRISMHGVREDLLDKQALATGIPLIKMFVRESNNNEYERNMEKALLKVKSEGIEHVIFGDIFLEDLRAYRENNLSKVGMRAIFPLWKKNTKDLMNRFLSLGFRTVICCVNDQYFGEERVGKEMDANFMNSLPTNVDPCGENGEFHTFCFSGPIFSKDIAFTFGERTFKPLEIKTDSLSSNQTTGFWFCDLIP
jgi:uncharacterized protein (TIGR00290 family)